MFLTLGSLFDGSGGFPLAGLLEGIVPVWASEIEPFPIRVTTKRLPQMKHYGDVSAINGADVEPVDIITFGSPCQDLSVAGKRAGLEGGRSGLFYQAVRIIKEMRGATNGRCPKFAVWENVPGAFSSNRGEDFRCVLEELAGVKDADVSIPAVEKWENAGELVGDSFSLAWRTLDAQYWGVPQRRRRIFLVADFDGERAGEILFNTGCESGDTAQSRGAGQRTAAEAERGVRAGGAQLTAGFLYKNSAKARSIGYAEEISPTPRAASAPAVLFENHPHDSRIKGPLDTAPANAAYYGTGGNNQPLVMEAYGICSKDSNSMKPDNPHSGIYKADTSRTLDTSGGNPACNQGGIAIVAAMSRDANCVVSEDITPPVVAAPAYSLSHGGMMIRGRKEFCDMLAATDYKDPPVVSYPETPKLLRERCGGEGGGKGPLIQADKSAALACNNDQTLFQPDNLRYIIRRLTPTECGRLQGFPDWWCVGLETENPTAEDLSFWGGVFDTYSRVTGAAKKSDAQILKWLQNPHSDSAEYKMWGNGVALPCVRFVLRAIAKEARKCS